MTHQPVPKISLDELRLEIKKEYTNVALDPNKGYHFHTGRRLAEMLAVDTSPDQTTVRVYIDFYDSQRNGFCEFRFIHASR